MIKYFKVDGIYHSKVDTETKEFEVLATKLNRTLFKKGIEEQGFIDQVLNTQEPGKVEITETEYLAAKELFKSQM